MEQAYRESKIYEHDDANRRVRIKRLSFCTWSEVMLEIRKERPSGLHFGCHAQKNTGLELFRQTVNPRAMVPQIKSWNRHARSQTPPRPEIRFIVYNSCESDLHALNMTDCVDFAIGHQDPVEDKNAIQFTRLLYDCVFDRASLADSFEMAKSACEGYRLLARRDPRKFLLVKGPTETTIGSSHYDCDGNELI